MADEELITIVTRASNGEYYLPEIQRGFLWKPAQVRNLCDSLYREYPINLLFLWKNSDYIQPQRGAPNHVREPSWVIDGQQRITSLCLLFGRRPFWYGPDEWTELRNKYKVYMNVNLGDDRVEFSGRPNGENWKSVEVSEVLTKEGPQDIPALAQEIAEGDTSISERILGPLLAMWNVRKTRVPVGEIVGRELEEITEIFERLNRGGTRIKETDIRFALIASHNPGWRREEFDPFLKDLDERGWDIQPGYLLQALTIFRCGKARMSEVNHDFWKQEVVHAWPPFKEAVDEVVTYLWDKGIPAIDLVPSPYTLIPLLAMHAKFRKTQDYSFDIAYRWFLRANMEGRYSGAPLENLTKDASAIYHSDTFGEALSKMRPRETAAKENLVALFQEPFRKREFASLLIHLFLWNRDAHDWLQPLTLRAAGTNNGLLQPHWHHILPKAWASRSDFQNADWVANVTILTESTNVRRLGMRPPWEYVPRNNISQQVLEEHFIPAEFSSRFVKGLCLTQQEFSEFLDGRAQLLAGEAEQYLTL